MSQALLLSVDTLVARRRPLSTSPADGWRESNPEADCDTALQNKALCEFKNGVAADWQRILRHSELCRGSDNDAIHSLGTVVAAWFQLPAVTREVIVALVQAT